MSAFPERADLARMVRYGLSVRLDVIASANKLPTMVFELIEWAEAHGKLDELLEGARSENPDNPALRSFAAEAARANAPTPFLVPSLNPEFLGRDRDLERLHGLLQRTGPAGLRPVALVGMGGIGKSQLAVAYAHAHRGTYPSGVYWVNAAAPLIAELATLGESVGLREDSASEAERPMRRARAFIRHLDGRPDALLIFDNAADPLVLRESAEGIARSPLGCRLLFTTRRRDLDASFETIDVLVLPDDTALCLLLSSEARRAVLDGARAGERETATAICKALGHLPLAIVLAAAYLAKFPRLALSSYLARLRREGALVTTAVARGGPRQQPMPQTGALQVALRAQWDALGTEEARQVLKTAALLRDAAHVSRATLALLTGLSDQAESGYAAPLDEALRELSEWSLVEEPNEAAIRLHPLVREFAEARIEEREAFAEACSTRLGDVLEEMDRLAAEVAARGLDAVLADLRLGAELAGAERRERLRRLLRPLDREAHCLRRWDPVKGPGFFLQQVRNMSFELGMEEARGRTEAALRARGAPWLRERIRTSRESEALVRTLVGHTSSVRGLVVTPDGRLVISGSDDGALKVWELESGCELPPLTGHASPVNSVAVTPNGAFVVSASEDGTLEVWEISSGRHVRSFAGHADLVRAVAVTRDGTRIISASEDGTLKEWELASGEELRTFTGHALAVNAVVCSSNGRLAISASDDKTLKVWELERGGVLRTLEGHTGDVTGVAMAPKGGVVVSASKDKTLKVWELESGQVLHTLEGHTRDVTGVAVTPDGRLAVSASDDDTLKVWELESGRELHTLEGHAEVNEVTVTPDGRWVISASKDSTLKVWELSASHQLRRIAGHDGAVTGVAVTPNGHLGVSASGDGTLKVWDLSSGLERHTLAGHSSSVTGVAVTPDGCLAVSASVDKTLKIWNLSSGLEVQTLQGHTWGVTAVAVTQDGHFIVSASGDKTLKVWERSSGQVRHTLVGHASNVTGVTVTRDARWAISTSEDTTLGLWDLADPQRGLMLAGHTNTVTAVAVTLDGHLAVSASEDTTLKVWDLAKKRAIRTLTGHTKPVNGVAVTPDGRLAISTSEDATLKVWDLATGQPIATLEAHAPLLCCAVSPDGHTFLAGDSAGSLHILDWLEA